MMAIWKSLFDPTVRQSVITRIQALRPDARPRFGKMSAPQMICHLGDQMRHALELSPVKPRSGPLRWFWVRWATIYLVPWPKGRVKGPSEAFLTQPAGWNDDIEELQALVERFAARGPDGDWPEHALLGPMSGADWGVFVYKHFDHHLGQFGV